VKWFKHFTDSLSDPFIEELMDNYSHAGYVAWFGLIEIICKENKYNVTGDLEISPIYLKRKLRISTTKLEQIFDFCQTKGKLLFNISQEKWVFKFSKVAELKDNYTKNLQATGKKVSLEVEVDKKKKEKKKKPIKKKDKKPIKKKDICILPDWLPLEEWKDFVEMRNKIKAPLTEKAVELAISKLSKLKDAGDNPAEVLNESIMNSYKGLFPLKKGKGGVKSGKHTGLNEKDYSEGIGADGSF
jgi:hypothetical protein